MVISLGNRAALDPRGVVPAHFALDAAGLGAWDIVPATGDSRWTARARLLLGFGPQEQFTHDQFICALRPADRCAAGAPRRPAPQRAMATRRARAWLHIAHQIVLEHGGSMEVMSDGVRTVVRVRLPKRRELASAQPARQDQRKMVGAAL